MTVPKWIQLYKNRSLGADSGTETFPLKTNDQICELLLTVRAKNGATANAPDAVAMPTIESSITGVQISSGAAIFKSYTGEINRKLATHRDGGLPRTMYTQAAGGTYAGNDDPALGWMSYDFPIRFNLKSDPYGNRSNVIFPAPLYAGVLDLTLDYNFTISATAGFLTGGANHLFDLYALVKPPESQEAMQQKRVLVERKRQNYTTTAEGDEPIKLTLSKDRFLRQLMVFCYENGIGEGIDITDMQLKVNGDVLQAGKWGNIQALNANHNNLNYYIDYYMKNVGATDELWTRIPAPIPMMFAGTSPTVAPFFTVLGTGDKVTVTTDAANDVNLMRIGSNVNPGVAVFDLDMDESLSNMQHCGVNDIELLLTNGGAGGSVEIIEQHIARPWQG